MITKHADHIITISNFWNDSKCAQFIRQSEKMGYEEATVQTEKGERSLKEVRNNQRILFSDENLANTIWSQIKNVVPNTIGKCKSIGLNEMFRFYKYDIDQMFRKHRDQSFVRNETDASFYTWMLYLNDDFKGGETAFNDITIKPETGMCLLFLHDLEHEGSKLLNGVKYVLRTDVMYRFSE